MLNLSCIADRHKLSEKRKQQRHRAHTHMHELVTSTTFFEQVPLFNEYNKCLCLLAKTIGFSDSVLANYLYLMEMQNYDFNTEKYLRRFESDNATKTTLQRQTMLSLVVQDIASGSLQLLSRGSPLFVLERCSEYWDGQSLKLLTDTHRDAIRKLFYQWEVVIDFQCIAFSYKPIEGKYKVLFKEQGVLASSDRKVTGSSENSESSYTDNTSDESTTTTTVSSLVKTETTYEVKKIQPAQEKRRTTINKPSNNKNKFKKIERSKQTKINSENKSSLSKNEKTTAKRSTVIRRLQRKKKTRSTSYLEADKREATVTHNGHDSAPEHIGSSDSLSLHKTTEHGQVPSQGSTTSDRPTSEYHSDQVMSEPLPRRQFCVDKGEVKRDLSCLLERSEEHSQNDTISNKGTESSRHDKILLSLSQRSQDKYAKENSDTKEEKNDIDENKKFREETSAPKQKEGIDKSLITIENKTLPSKDVTDNNSEKKESLSSTNSNERKKNMKHKRINEKLEGGINDVNDKNTMKQPNIEHLSSEKSSHNVTTPNDTTDSKKELQSCTEPLQQQSQTTMSSPSQTTTEKSFKDSKSTPQLLERNADTNDAKTTIEQKECIVTNNDEVHEVRDKEHLTSDTSIQPETKLTEEKPKENSDSLDELRLTFQNVCRDQTFLGMAAVRFLPKLEVPNFIEELNEAFIRFIYFSKVDEQKTKLFADRLGLETDWNCCISLKEKERSAEVKPSLNSSSQNLVEKLPQGISHIRRHIENVDDVPLLVRMFSDSTPQNTKEMIQILQENGEVCVVVGSALQPLNIPIYAQADLAISMLPSRTVTCSDDTTANARSEGEELSLGVGAGTRQHRLNKKQSSQGISPASVVSKSEVGDSAPEEPPRLSYSELSSANFADYSSSGSLAVDLNSMPCDLIMRADSNFFDIYELLKMGRHLLHATQQVTSYSFLIQST